MAFQMGAPRKHTLTPFPPCRISTRKHWTSEPLQSPLQSSGGLRGATSKFWACSPTTRDARCPRRAEFSSTGGNVSDTSRTPGCKRVGSPARTRRESWIRPTARCHCRRRYRRAWLSSSGTWLRALQSVTIAARRDSRRGGQLRPRHQRDRLGHRPLAARRANQAGEARRTGSGGGNR